MWAADTMGRLQAAIERANVYRAGGASANQPSEPIGARACRRGT
jgi:hypothetical protein